MDLFQTEQLHLSTLVKEQRRLPALNLGQAILFHQRLKLQTAVLQNRQSLKSNLSNLKLDWSQLFRTVRLLRSTLLTVALAIHMLYWVLLVMVKTLNWSPIYLLVI